MSDLLHVEKRGHIAIITMNNPPANIWTVDSLYLLKDIVEGLNADKSNYALVLTGQGEKFFCAGADLKMFADGDKDNARKAAQAFGDCLQTLTDYEGVSIAAINGFAMGGGLEAAMCCDIRIAESQAKMALPEAKVGLLPCGLGTQHLPALVGEGWAKRMILCNEQLKADKALQIGLVQEVVETGKALEAALALAERVAEQSPSSVKVCKKLIMGARNRPMSENLAHEREAFIDLFDTKDQLEGVTAFLEKRKPEWTNS